MKKLTIAVALALGICAGTANYVLAEETPAAVVTGNGSGETQGTALAAGSAATPDAPTASPAPEDLARDVYRGITTKDWFLVAGGALCLVTLGVRWLLAKKWPKVESKLYGVALVAALAGVGALGNAWIADERLATTTTLLGALKVWAAAVFLYVTSKNVLRSAPAASTGA